MISVRHTLADWCEANLSRFGFEKAEFSSMPPDHGLDKAGLSIEHEHLVASFTAWGEQCTTEWLVMDTRSGETVISRDEEFCNEQQLTALVEKAMHDITASGATAAQPSSPAA